jgi:S1-C subfamily serine protease
MPKPNEYVISNYDALNAHAEGVVANEKQLRRLKKFRADRVWIRNAGMLMLAIGLFAILLATAYYIYKKYSTVVPGPVQIERVEVEVPGPVKIERVEVEVPGPVKIEWVEVEVPAPPSIVTTVPPSLPVKPIIVYRDVPGPPIIIIKKVPMQASENIDNFTLWYKKDIDKNGIGSVITGADYENVDSKFPVLQYCYVSPKITDSNISKNIELAQKSGRNDIEWKRVTNEDAQSFGSTAEALEEVKKHCTFRDSSAIVDKSEPVTPYPSKPPSSGVLGSGSGFYVNNKGYILTNNHVVDQCSKVWINHNNKNIAASVLKTNKQHDLAIIETDQDNKFFVKFTELVDPVEDVMALGFPQVDILGGEIKRNKGNISSLTGMQGNNYSLQHTALIQKGSSGGPLLNNKGSLVGVNYAKFTDKDLQGIGLAIHAITAVSFLGENSIDFEMNKSKEKIDWTNIYEQGKNFTVRVLCAK